MICLSSCYRPFGDVRWDSQYMLMAKSIRCDEPKKIRGFPDQHSKGVRIMATIKTRRPSWYTAEDDTAWEKVKAAFRRDWTQTKHDMGGNDPNLNQQVGDTVAQATGSKPIPPGNAPTPHPSKMDEYSEAHEPAYSYGYAAYRHKPAEWDDSTESYLRKEWGDETDWQAHRDAVRRGYTFGKLQSRLPR